MCVLAYCLYLTKELEHFFLPHTVQDLEVAADFSITSGVPCLLEALKKKNYVKVGLIFLVFAHFSPISLFPSSSTLISLFPSQIQIPGLEELQVFVPCGLKDQRPLILQLLNAAAGKDCSKEPDEMAEDDAYLLMSKHGAGGATTDPAWALWDGKLLKLVPQMEAIDTLRAMKVLKKF